MRSILLKALLLILSVMEFNYCLATTPLSGTYTLDTNQAVSPNNFNSFSTLASHLNTYGVSGRVTINVAGGTYYEQLDLNNVSGTSASHKIIIQGDPNDSIRPTLKYSATTSSDDFIVKLTQMSYLTIRNMNLVVGDTMYGNIIDLNGGNNSNILFQNDSLITLPKHFTGSGSWPIPVLSENFLTGPNRNLVFRNNYIFGGTMSFYCRAGSSSQEAHIVLDGNEIVAWERRAILIQDFDFVSIRNNRISCNSTWGGDGIELLESANSEIIQNELNLSSTLSLFGILVYESTEFKVIGNKVNTITPYRNTGIEIRESQGTIQNRSVVANNMIFFETHIYTSFIGLDDLVGLHAHHSSYTNYVNNSILIHGDSARSVGLLIELPSVSFFSADAIGNNVYNNNIVNNSKGHAVMTRFTSHLGGLDSLNNNNYYSNGSHIGLYGSSPTNLQQWQAQTGLDSRSLNENPNYFSNDDLHILSQQLDGAAKVLSYVGDDFDLEPRSSSAPDIGADEYFVCHTPDSLRLDSLNSRFALASWSSENDTTFWILRNLTTGLDTNSYGIPKSLIMDWLTENTSYQLRTWHNCNTEGVQSDTIPLNFTTPSCPQLDAQLSYSKSFLGVHFNSSNSVGQDSVYWSLGDSTQSSSIQPYHTYDSAGFYNVTLQVYNYSCNDTSYIDSLIQVCDTVYSTFNFSQNQLKITAYNQSVNADSLLWSFGDGNSAVGDSVQHTYNQDGTYPLTLVAFNACGEPDTSEFMVTVCDTSQASFTYQIINQDSLNTYVQFDGTSSLNAQKFVWDFGDGSIDSSNLSPLHLYPSGTYSFTAQLTVFNQCGDGDSSLSSVNYISRSEQFTNTTFRLFPNPTNGKFTVEFQKGLPINRLVIRDATSRNVMEYKPSFSEIAQGSIQLEVNSKLGGGIYSLEINSLKHQEGIIFVIQED